MGFGEKKESLNRPMSCFEEEELLLRLQPSRITRQSLVLANHSVARDEQGERIGSNGVGHGSHGFWSADPHGHIPV